MSDWPILSEAELAPDSLSRELTRAGCCLVRGLIGAADVTALRALARDTYREFDAGAADAPEAARSRPETLVDRVSYTTHAESSGHFRRFGSIPLLYCPAFADAVCVALERTGVPRSASAWLGGRAGLALTSSSVRLSEVAATAPPVFHQDGNFLGGEATRTLNCWIALDPCGKEAPGLEVFPRRIDRLLPAGGPASHVDWEIDTDFVYEAMGADRRWIPEFQPGDAFIFDHMHVHRTHRTPEMTSDRYAIECWLFPSVKRYQENQLLWLENA